MPASPVDQPKLADPENDVCQLPTAATGENTATDVPFRPLLNFGCPDPGEKPLGFLRLMVILISSHIGVRSRINREEDFRRANGLHVFVAGIVYFLLVVCMLVLLVNAIAR